MRNYSRFTAPLIGAFLFLVLTACEQDTVTPSTETEKFPTLAEAVKYGEDGSFSYSLTKNQMSYILGEELGLVVNNEIESISTEFAQVAYRNSPYLKKPGKGVEKTITYGIAAQVITTTTADPNNPIFDFDGIGGLSSTAGPITKSADGFRRQNLTSSMIAFCWAFTSEGENYIFSRNDSSFGLGICPGKTFERNLKGDADITFNGVNNISGAATVVCSRGVTPEEPIQIRF